MASKSACGGRIKGGRAGIDDSGHGRLRRAFCQRMWGKCFCASGNLRVTDLQTSPIALRNITCQQTKTNLPNLSASLRSLDKLATLSSHLYGAPLRNEKTPSVPSVDLQEDARDVWSCRQDLPSLASVPIHHFSRLSPYPSSPIYPT